MKTAILGCGTMGRAIISGLLAKYDDVSIVAYDKDETALTSLPDEVVVLPPEEWLKKENIPDAIIIAVKPHDVEQSLQQLSSYVEDLSGTVWISIAAGVSLSRLEGYLSPSAKICRVMPNAPALIGQGISAITPNSRCDEDDAQLAEELLSACGKIVKVPEKMINAITGLSGSGPAYVYLFIEALIEGGVTAGLPYAVAKECAVQTVIGSARMVEQSNENTSALKARVMTPGGTTAKGIMVLEENKFKYSVIKAVTEATARAEELGKQG